MKIGIITQPLHTNYGGLLQNYALQQVLQKLGHDSCTIRRGRHIPFFTLLRNNIKLFIKRIIRKNYNPSEKENRIIRRKCENFTNKYIKTTKTVHNNKEIIKIIGKHEFTAYIVGSDQVWRPCYSPCIYNEFLDFCKNAKNVKRIAYAASFGVSNWEYSEEESAKCAELAKQFNAISVREDSGVALCEKYLGVQAEHLLDPTMLLEKSEYEQLANDEKEEAIDGDLFCYILDSNKEKTDIRNNFEKTLHYKSFEVKAAKSGLINKHSDLSEYIVPSPTKWIRAFMDAKMVLTDSFHGCVFSIIFNKPFWVIENRERGNARFDSLLKLFNLEHRRIDINNLGKIDLSTPIDWQQVNTIRDEWKKKSIDFLVKNL